MDDAQGSYIHEVEIIVRNVETKCGALRDDEELIERSA